MAGEKVKFFLPIAQWLKHIALSAKPKGASIYKNLHKRLQNVKSPQKRQGPTPERGHKKKRHCIDFSETDEDSPTAQARHYQTLQELYKKPKPNQDAVSQILELEFQARRSFIDSDVLKEQDRPTKILDAYPCFKDLHHPTEDPTIYLQKRSLCSPVLLFDWTRCLICLGATPATRIAKEDLSDGLLYLMGYYYALHRTYPKCVATLLSVIQTEVLQDTIHERDTTASYKTTMAEWKDFIGK
ncbi:uncharacterized protein LOC122764463 [Xyrichtys novacula]|uniref:Uncharacterized protein LOC122764463 n=1 Tax=Xyrichtys novacula TaxID=13765 RepID=A0AAV1EXN1_XYRNO|nr:uncharacterized protein LOC122764463 [Xyrichtys novacula]